MNKFISLFLLIIWSYNCDINGLSTCTVFEKIISSDLFEKEFYICKKTNEDWVINDINSFFGDCELEEYCGNTWKLISKPELKSKEQNYLELYRVDEIGNKYTFYFKQPYSGSAVILTYYFNENRWELIKSEYGSF